MEAFATKRGLRLRCLQNAQQHRRANGADRGNLAEPLPGFLW